MHTFHRNRDSTICVSETEAFPMLMYMGLVKALARQLDRATYSVRERFELDHLVRNQQGYFEHMVDALWIGSTLGCGAFAACFHSCLPQTFQGTASGCARKVCDFVEAREAELSKDQ